MTDTQNKVIITVLGRDSVGIIAKVCTYLSGNGINILDISQTITGGYFNMMMFADLSLSLKPFGEVSDELSQIGDELGVKINCQKEEIFNMMHRV